MTGYAPNIACPDAYGRLTTVAPRKDSDWSDEEKVKDDRFAYLADIMAAGGLSFDEDDVLANNDDEDLQKDPVSQIDLRVSAHMASQTIPS
jgi:hypothetical protein